MKLRDMFSIAIRGLWHNKSRTILTIIIVMSVSTLMMGLICLGFSFRDNLIKISKDIFMEKGTYMYLFPREDINSEFNSDFLQKEEISVLIDSIQDYNELVDGFYLSTNQPLRDMIDVSNKERTEEEITNLFNDEYNTDFYSLSKFNDEFPTFTTFSLPINTLEDGIISGRVWTKEDRGTNHVWLSSTLVEKIADKTGKMLKVGDEFCYRGANYFFDENSMQQYFVVESRNYVLKGVFDQKRVSPISTYYYIDEPVFICDVENALESDFFSVYYSILDYKPKSNDYDFNEVYSRLKTLSNDINSKLKPHNLDSFTMTFSFLFDIDRFKVAAVSSMRLVEIYSTVIIGLLTVLSALVLLISIGSVTNTIIISIEKNKKFTGILKAVGLTDKGVRRIVTLEMSLQILSGVMLGFLSMFLIQPIILFLTDKLILALFYNIASGIKYTTFLVVPLFVPPICFLVFALTAIIGSRRSVARLNSMDVISIMGAID